MAKPTPVAPPAKKTFPTAQLVVVVTQAPGKPVKDAEIEIVGLRGGPGSGALTDSQGRIGFDKLPVQKWDIKVRKNGFGPPASPFTAGEAREVVTDGKANGHQEVPITLVGTSRLIVTVKGPKGGPIENAAIEVVGLRGGGSASPIVSDHQGRKDFGEVEALFPPPPEIQVAKDWVIKVNKKGLGPVPPSGTSFAPGEVSKTVTPNWGGTTNVEIVMAGVFTLKGKLFYKRKWDYNTAGALAPPVKEFLPFTEVELRTQEQGATSLTVHSTVFTDKDGNFEFKDIPPSDKGLIRINLRHKDGKICSVEGQKLVSSGNATPFSEANFEVKDGQVVWHQIDIPEIPGAVEEVDKGELEITHEHFTHLCDAYKTVLFGHQKLKDLTGSDMPLCKIVYPEEKISNASVVMSLLRDDLRDRDVILHEYGHFIGHHTFAGGLNNPGYDYNDDVKLEHGPDSKEHYEAAWVEGHATFLSCALQDDPIYHDGYDGNFTQDMTSDHSANGPHNEAAIQEALWIVFKTDKISLKDGFWKAFSASPKPETIFGFLENWKSTGTAHADKLVAALKARGMEFGYHYLGDNTAGDRWKAAAAFDLAKKEFKTVDELFNQFGTVAGEAAAGAASRKTQYMEEFYNRNKKFNAGSLAAGSTIAAPAVTAGAAYIVPQRFQIST